MTFTVIEKTENPCVSVQEAKHFLKVSHDLEDGLIENCVAAAMDWVEQHTGQIIEKKKIELFVPLNRRVQKKRGLSIPIWHSSGRSLFFFPITPLIEITQVHLISIKGESTEIPLRHVHLNQTKNPPFLVIDVFSGWGFRLQCWAGYTQVPPFLKHALFKIIAYLYENRSGAANIYQACGYLLEPFRRVNL